MTAALLGYADRLSVAPGELIRFMVSADVPAYEARLVRLIHGDERPPGPGYREEELESAVNGTYAGGRQDAFAGSFVAVPSGEPLGRLDATTVQAWIYPTTPDKPGLQGLVGKWAELDGRGFLLGIDSGRLLLWLGAGGAREPTLVVHSGATLTAGRWHFVAGAYDSATGQVRLAVQRLDPRGPRHLTDAALHEQQVESGLLGPNDEPLLMAAAYLEPVPRARSEPAAHRAPRGLYNGKIDAPRLYGRALSGAELDGLWLGEDVARDALVAAWDFARDIGSTTVTATAGARLHGTTVNMPMRAVTGHRWSGEVTDFKLAPDQYGAIHFHEDDLEDSGWEPSFALRVPGGTRSGVYAVRLRADAEEEYIPFYVRPPRGAASAPIVFLAPTMTYLAYANERQYWKEGYAENRPKITTTLLGPPDLDRFVAEHDELGRSLYDFHTDRSGVCYSSRLRPILNMRPKYRAWRLHDAPRHFAADLYLIGWLEAKGFAYDVVTDEDLHHEGAGLLQQYRAVLTGSHPEYWTTPMHSALVTYLATGGRLMYLGGNGFYWVTSVDPVRPHVIEVRRGVSGTRAWESAPGELFHSTTGELGGLWRYRGKSPHWLTGVGFAAQGWGGAPGYVRQPDSHRPEVGFIFEGIGQDEVIGDFGMVMGGAAGDEIDRMDHDLGTPPETLLLATTAGRHSDYYQVTVEDVPIMIPGQGGTESPKVRADMTYLPTASGGAVFSVGSINWLGSLNWNNYANNVSRITENVLRHFMDTP
jgi:N,N-dimethylformamidase